MSQKSSAPAARPYDMMAKPSVEQAVRDIRRATRKHHSAEDKIRIVLEGLRGEDSIAVNRRSKVTPDRRLKVALTHFWWSRSAIWC